MPTPYELASIAAALGRKAAEKPAQAARDALALWHACRAEIDAETRAIEQRQSDALQHARNPDDESLSMQQGEEYPAMEWVNIHAEQTGEPRDVFKTFRAFKAAWLKYDPNEQDFHFSHRVYELKRFLASRKEQRLGADAKRKRLAAERKRLARAKTKGAKIMSKKIATGKQGKNLRTKRPIASLAPET